MSFKSFDQPYGRGAVLRQRSRMRMYELFVVACLIAQPARCEEFQLPFHHPMGITECIRESQLHLIEWLADHSDWVIRRWSCKMPQA